MKKLEKAKEQTGNKFYTEAIFKTIELIKSTVNLSSDFPFYLLFWCKSRQIFLNDGRVFCCKD